MNKKEITLRANQDFITLQSLLQVLGFIETGGMAKSFLSETTVMVNNEPENRRGRKLYQGDEIRLLDAVILVKKYDS